MAVDRETIRVIETGDVMSSMWREIVGGSVQLRIPLRDPVDLRRCATILRELAADIEKYAGLTDREAAFYEAGKAFDANKRAWRAFWCGLASGVVGLLVASARWWFA